MGTTRYVQDMTARDSIAFLVGSDKRLSLLRELADGSDTPSTLASRSSCARETAQRTLGEFVDRGWAKQTGTEYELTGAGQIVLDAYDEFAAEMETADRLSDFLLYADDVVSDLPRSVLAEVEVTNTTAENPHATIDRYLSVLGTDHVSTFKGISPIVSRIFNEAAQGVTDSETMIELVIDESVLQTSQREYSESLLRAFELENMDLYLSPDPLDFGLAVIDGHVFVGAYTESGRLVSSIDGTDERFRQWALDRFESYRENCRELDLQDTNLASTPRSRD
jgi:predicted transcriptional regulator